MQITTQGVGPPPTRAYVTSLGLPPWAPTTSAVGAYCLQPVRAWSTSGPLKILLTTRFRHSKWGGVTMGSRSGPVRTATRRGSRYDFRRAGARPEGGVHEAAAPPFPPLVGHRVALRPVDISDYPALRSMEFD